MMSEYSILDNADARQIETADASIRQSLAYDLRGKKQISFAGIKWLVLQMSQHDQPLTIDIVDLHLEKYTDCLLYTSPSPRDRQKSRMPSSA